MIRDFTNETLSELEEIAEGALNEFFTQSTENSYHNELVHTITVADENCIADLSSIEAEAEDLQLINEEGDTINEKYISKLERIFSEARDRDAESLSTVEDRINEVYDPFIESMQQLSNCIDTSALGNDQQSFNYNRGYYHSNFSNSIYGEPDSFGAKVDAIEGGVCSRSYAKMDDYMENEEELEALKEFMNRDPDTLEPWEKTEVIMLVNDCVEYDENGDPSINYEKISKLLSAGYKQADLSSDNLFTNGTTYITTPMMDYMAESYNDYYTFTASCLGEMNEDLIPFANLNAIINGTVFYYGEVTTDWTPVDDIENADLSEYEWDEVIGYYVPFGITVSLVEGDSDIDRDVICINTTQLDSSEYNILNITDTENNEPWKDGEYGEEKDKGNNIYIEVASTKTLDFQSALKNKQENAKEEVSEALLNKLTGNCSKKITNSGKTEVVNAFASKIPQIKTIVKVYETAVSYADVAADTKEKNKQIDKQIAETNTSSYVEDLEISGNVCSNGKNKVLVSSVTYDDDTLEMKVKYYNIKNNRNITSDELKSAFDEFLESDASKSETLDNFHNTIKGNFSSKDCNHDLDNVTFEDFERKVNEKLEELYGIKYYEKATEEQINGAIDSITNWENGDE